MSEGFKGRFVWEAETLAVSGDCNPYYEVDGNGMLTGGLVDPHDHTGYTLVNWDWERMRLVGVAGGAYCAVAEDRIPADFAAVLAYESAGGTPKPDGYDDPWGPITDDPNGRYMVVDATRSDAPDPYFRERWGGLWTRFPSLDRIAPGLRCVIEADSTVGEPEHSATFRFFRLDGGLVHSFELGCTYDPLEPGKPGYYWRNPDTTIPDDPADVIAAEVDAANARLTPAATADRQPPALVVRERHERYWSAEDGTLTYCENPFHRSAELSDRLDYEPQTWLAPGYDLARIADGLDASQKGMGEGEEWMVCRHTVFVRRVSHDWWDELSTDEAGEWQPVLTLVPAGGVFDVSPADPFAPVNPRTRRMEVRGCDHPKRMCVSRAASVKGTETLEGDSPR